MMDAMQPVTDRLRNFLQYVALKLIDEPSKGLAPSIVNNLIDAFRQLKRQDTTILLVEQNARMALGVCDRGYIMEKGTIVFEGEARDLRESPVTREKLGV